MKKTIIDWDDQPLGEVSDQKLASKLGVPRSRVLRARRQRGIKPSGKRYGYCGPDRDLGVDEALDELGEGDPFR